MTREKPVESSSQVLGSREGERLAGVEVPGPGLEGIVDVKMMEPIACVSPKISPSSQGGGDGGGGGEMKQGPTDWHSVVKDMLSVHLPASKLPPRFIVTEHIRPSPFGNDELSHSHKIFAACAFPPEPEPLRSGSPRASRSPMAAASPRSSVSGLHLLRIDESQALDTTSDCGSDVADLLELTAFQDERQPFGQPFRRSRLGTDAAQARASVTGGGEWDEAAGVPGDGAPEDQAAVSAVAASPTAQEVAAASSPQPAVLDSDVVRLKGLQIKTCVNPPKKEKQPLAEERPSLAQYRPDPSSLGRMAAVFPGSHSRKMRRSVIHRISDHGGLVDFEEGRLKFEDDRLALDGLRRDVEATVDGVKSLSMGVSVQQG